MATEVEGRTAAEVALEEEDGDVLVVKKRTWVEDKLSHYAPMQAFHTFVRGFTVAYAIREGITVSLRLLEIVRKKGFFKLFSFERVLRQSLADRVQAVR